MSAKTNFKRHGFRALGWAALIVFLTAVSFSSQSEYKRITQHEISQQTR